MPKNIVVLICEDPNISHRASEAIRIALGLSTGPNPLQILLLGNAKYLITEEAYDLPDGEMLEKYLPSIQSLEIPIFVDADSAKIWNFDSDFSIQELGPGQLEHILVHADRVLAF
jgi:hypothetical protein